MNPWFDKNGVTLYHGDNRLILPTLAAGSVNCCVTSPPYFGLRDYGTAKWEGGDAACDHTAPKDWIESQFNANSSLGCCGTQSAAAARWFNDDGSCRCGAVRVDSQIGLEKSPDKYVAELVKVFREVRRVLRDDGVLFCNLGDSYASNWPCSRRNVVGQGSMENGKRENRSARMSDGLKEKDLIGIPWMVAFSLRADGWYLRQDIIWAKPNPMPESVTDRCTKSHEYIFLLSKSATYHCDMDAIKEPATESNAARPRMGQGSNTQYEQKRASWNGSKFQTGKTGEHQQGRASKKRGEFNGKTNELPGREAFRAIVDTRNKRSVWTVPLHPYAAAHFATFPPALIEPCIKAGVPLGGVCIDPFFGAGTTGLVCQQQHVRCIGVELNEKYCAIAKNRLAQGGLQFASE